MKGVVDRLMVVVLALLCTGCSLVNSPAEEETEGYLLRGVDEKTEEDVGILFVQYTVDPASEGERMPGKQVIGRMYTASPEADAQPPGVSLSTSPIRGIVDGERILIQEELPSQTGDLQEVFYLDHQGTLENDTMELTRNTQGVLFSWEGEAATLEDFGAAAEELATEGVQD